MKKFELRPCPDCGCTDPLWCGISHRPHCPDCGKWGAVNFGTDLDAVNAWNKPTQLETLILNLEAMTAERDAQAEEIKRLSSLVIIYSGNHGDASFIIDEQYKEIERLKAELAPFKTTEWLQAGADALRKEKIKTASRCAEICAGMKDLNNTINGKALLDSVADAIRKEFNL